MKTSIALAALALATLGGVAGSAYAADQAPSGQKSWNMADREREECMRDIFGWRSRKGRDYLRVSPPSYMCQVVFWQDRGRGVADMYYQAPSEAEYGAYVSVLNGFVRSDAVQVTLQQDRDITYWPVPGNDFVGKDNLAANLKTIDTTLSKLASAIVELGLKDPASVRSLNSKAGPCGEDARDAILAVKSKAARDVAMADYDNRCKQQKPQQKAAAEDDLAVPTLADLKPVSTKKIDPARVPGLLSHPDIKSVTVGVASAPEMTVVIDVGSPYCYRALLSYWPTVRDGGLRLRIIPISLYDSKSLGDGARILAAQNPMGVVQIWMRHGVGVLGSLKQEAEGRAAACKAVGSDCATERQALLDLFGTPDAEKAARVAIERNNALFTEYKLHIVPLQVMFDSAGGWKGRYGIHNMMAERDTAWPHKIQWSYGYDNDKMINALKPMSGELDTLDLSKGAVIAKRLTRQVCGDNGKCWLAAEQ